MIMSTIDLPQSGYPLVAIPDGHSGGKLSARVGCTTSFKIQSPLIVVTQGAQALTGPVTQG